MCKDTLVIDIGHYQPLFLVLESVICERCNQYCNKCAFVNITSLIAFMILVIVKKMLERIIFHYLQYTDR